MGEAFSLISSYEYLRGDNIIVIQIPAFDKCELGRINDFD